MRALLAVCCLPAVSLGLRHERPRTFFARDAARVQPIGRHIQYRALNTAGMGDRIHMINWLMRLASIHNATLHIQGGELGADHYLTSAHSTVVNRNWSHYFDVPRKCGLNPFLEVENFEPCTSITTRNPDWNGLFSNGSLCVNIDANFYTFKNMRSLVGEGKRKCNLGAAYPAEIENAARDFLARNKVPQRYGAYHIRRCDALKRRRQKGGNCTEVSAVRAFIENRSSEVDAWVIFSYAEEGYSQRLKEELGSLNATGKPIVFEDDDELNPLHDGDNYYAYRIASWIMLNAKVWVLPKCSGERPMTTKDRDLSAAKVVSEAVCGGGSVTHLGKAWHAQDWKFWGGDLEVGMALE